MSHEEDRINIESPDFSVSGREVWELAQTEADRLLDGLVEEVISTGAENSELESASPHIVYGRVLADFFGPGGEVVTIGRDTTYSKQAGEEQRHGQYLLNFALPTNGLRFGQYTVSETKSLHVSEGNAGIASATLFTDRQIFKEQDGNYVRVAMTTEVPNTDLEAAYQASRQMSGGNAHIGRSELHELQRVLESLHPDVRVVRAGHDFDPGQLLDEGEA